MLGEMATPQLASPLLFKAPTISPTRAMVTRALSMLTAVALFVCVASAYTLHGSARVSYASAAIQLEKTGWQAPKSEKRCEWIANLQKSRDQGKPLEALKEQYNTVATDPNTFYRGTAHLFWEDFVRGGWGEYDLRDIGIASTLADGSPIERTSTWTWCTGDQHLSNFGAWQNRHGDVVHGVNDFDEAAIFDFRIDVWRVAVSIYNHALSNNLGAA